MELDNNRKVEIIIGLFLLGGIITWLVIPMSFQDTTIILESGNNAGSGGVTSLTSANAAVALNASSGSVLITPKMQLLCQDIASSGDTSLNCSTFTSHRYYQIYEYHRVQTTTATFGLQFNSDSGNNYAFRFSTNNGGETATTNTNQCLTTGSLGNGQYGETTYQFSNNELGQNKVGYGTVSGSTTNGAGNAPFRVEIACRWADTSNNITDIDIVRLAGTGTIAEGSLSVWGYD
jgi:hypothetical protein